MKRIAKYLLLLAVALLAPLCAVAQMPSNTVKWRMNVKMTSATEGEVILIATISEGWHLYGMNLPKDGPKSTEFDFAKSTGVKFTSAFTPSVEPKKYHDEMFGMTLTCWENKVTFRRKFKVTDPKTAEIIGSVKFMSCNDATCSAPSTEKFNKKVQLPK